MYYFIINPYSSSGHGMALWKTLQEELQKREFSYQALQTMYPGHATKLVAKLCKTPTQKTVIVIGGDGTLSEVIQGLLPNANITIGYIPSGSGNDFARSLKLTSPPLQQLCSLLESTTIQQIDYGILSFQNKSSRRFVVSCGAGFDANICYKNANSNIKKILNRFHLGSLSYLVVGIPSIFTYKGCNATLILDEKETIPLTHLFFTSVHIHPFEGGGFGFAPTANYQDGFLDICVVEAKWIPKRIYILLCSLLQKHIHCKGVHIYRCQKATFHFEEPTYFHTDGECPVETLSSFTVSSSPFDHFSFLF